MVKKARTRERQTDESAQLPAAVQEQRDFVTAGEHLNYNTSVASSAWTYLASGAGSQWSQEAWEQQLSITCTRLDGPTEPAEDNPDYDSSPEKELEFDIKGIDPAIANALRRILLEEVPTMAIEQVFVINNTSILPDEMLAHRLGLVPIRADPSSFVQKTASGQGDETNVLVFKLKAGCVRKQQPDGQWAVQGENGAPCSVNPVYSSQLEWLPEGSEIPEESNCHFQDSQADVLAEPARPVHHNILLAKLRPGQEIEVECHATRSNGKDHAKWSPVSTAWYRLKPEVVIEDVHGNDAQELADKIPGLIVVEGPKRAAVARPARDHPELLEKVRALASDERWQKRVRLRRDKTHFLFTIQSTGQLPPDRLFEMALDQLSEKADSVLQQLDPAEV